MASLNLRVFAFPFLILLPLVYSTGDLTYVCQPESGDTVRIVIDKTEPTISGCTMSAHSSCKDSSNGTTFVLSNCPKNTDIVVEFQKLESHHVLRKANEHIFTLNCHRKDNPVVRTITGAYVTMKKPAATTPSVHNFEKTDWVPEMSMSVDKSTNVVIGEMLKLTITSPVQKYKFAAQTCKARSGSGSGSDVLDLWDYSNCKNGDQYLFKKTEPWTPANIASTSVISHSFEAFKFSTSDTLALECSVIICPIGQEAKCTEAYDCKDGIRRRRRDVKSRTTVVKTSLHVVDLLQDNTESASGSLVATSSLLCIAVAIDRLLLR